jgi:hypothetical protein
VFVKITRLLVLKSYYILRLLRKQSLTALESEYLTKKILFDKQLNIKGVSLSWFTRGNRINKYIDV